jgi:hypothetical protein
MSQRSQERRAAKRKEKARQLRRLAGASPMMILAPLHTIECYRSDLPSSDRLIDIIAIRPDRQGRDHAAGFLIDRDCIGLKDAFVKFDVSRTAIRDNVASHGLTRIRIPIEEVRSLVASAIRWTRDHNFRLPPDMRRAVEFLGGVGDPSTADTAGFGTPDGKLLYIGRLQDLQSRLSDMTVQEFSNRPDVEFLVEAPEPPLYYWSPEVPFDDDFFDDLDDSEFEFCRVVENQVFNIEERCLAHAVKPNRFLPRALSICLNLALTSTSPQESAGIDAAPTFAARISDAMINSLEEDAEDWSETDAMSLLHAIPQIMAFVFETFSGKMPVNPDNTPEAAAPTSPHLRLVTDDSASLEAVETKSP